MSDRVAKLLVSQLDERSLISFCRNPLLILPIPSEVLVRVCGFDPRFLLAYRVNNEGRSASSALS